jgi:4'-phosphopantetheinyl transferase
MIAVYWLEQTEAEVPEGTDWLSAREAVHLNALRFAKRRADWRLGRWTAKSAVAAYLKMASNPVRLAEVEIRPSCSGAPEVFIGDWRAEFEISLTHRAGRAACAVATSDTALGCDLELVEPHSEAFVADYFTGEEQAFIADAAAADRDGLIALLWSAKESALKALHTGLRLATCSLQVKLDPILRERDISTGTFFLALPAPCAEHWHPLEIRSPKGTVFCGWWQYNDLFVRTLAAMPQASSPLRLQSYSGGAVQSQHLHCYAANQGIDMVQRQH